MSRDGFRELVDRIAALSRERLTPLLVAIDGRSGVGKSTLAVAVSAELAAAVIDGDDFYSGGGAVKWDAMTPAERVDHCIDWRRQLPVLGALCRGEVATWRPYDWEVDDGRLADHLLTCPPRPVVILAGAYSARPQLAHLLDLRVMLDAPDEARRQRLRRREGEHYRAKWEARWALAEEYYFEQVMPPAAFDLVIRSEGL
jgi:uridine kinase